MKKKKAFTLAEMLIFMGIAMVVLTSGIMIFKNFDKGIRYIYSNTFHALDRAIYNGMNFTNLPSPFDPGTEQNPVTPDQGKTRLCNMLSRYINNIENLDNNNYPENCSLPGINLMGSDADFNGRTPHIIAANGVRLYITDRQRLAQNEQWNNLDRDIYFYIVFADINGTKRPNSMRYVPSQSNNNKTIDPDIFAFAVLDIANVCPLGPPEIDTRYMKTRVTYQGITEGDNNGEGREQVTRYSQVSKPYIFSKKEAWGFYDGTPQASSGKIIEDEPLSYNDAIRRYLAQYANGNMIYSFGGFNTNADRNLDVPEYIRLQSNSVQNGGWGCKSAFSTSEIPCQVIVDRYIY